MKLKMKMNKKGIAQATLAELILVIAAIVIALVFVMTIVGFINPAVGGLGCGLNIRVYSATVQATGEIIGAPILMCNQYREPIEINAADFNACQGLAEFCFSKVAEDDPNIRSQCIQQCARIQIDALTDTCWSMGGSGRLNLQGTIWKQIGDWVASLGDMQTYFETFFKAGLAAVRVSPFVLGGPVMGAYGYSSVDAAVSDFERSVDDIVPKKAQILRCNRFQVTNPAILPNRQPFTLQESTFGITKFNALDAESCAKLGRRECPLGGRGVKAANPEPGFERELSLKQAYMLNYNIAEPRQICYMAYYEYETFSGALRYSPARTCDYWTRYSERSSGFLN
jgi:hypothetical protein